MNAAALVGLSLGHPLSSDGIDASGRSHAGLNSHPVPVLNAAPTSGRPPSSTRSGGARPTTTTRADTLPTPPCWPAPRGSRDRVSAIAVSSRKYHRCRRPSPWPTA
ncbi:hypothetical protein [Streptosporangium sp. NPDC002607]